MKVTGQGQHQGYTGVTKCTHAGGHDIVQWDVHTLRKQSPVSTSDISLPTARSQLADISTIDLYVSCIQVQR